MPDPRQLRGGSDVLPHIDRLGRMLRAERIDGIRERDNGDDGGILGRRNATEQQRGVLSRKASLLDAGSREQQNDFYSIFSVVCQRRELIGGNIFSVLRTIIVHPYV